MDKGMGMGRGNGKGRGGEGGVLLVTNVDVCEYWIQVRISGFRNSFRRVEII